MRHALLAALAATLCHASVAAAGDRPSHDPAIEAAAIAILQKRLPEIRAAVMGTEDMREGMQSFIERRPAVFKGK